MYYQEGIVLLPIYVVSRFPTVRVWVKYSKSIWKIEVHLAHLGVVAMWVAAEFGCVILVRVCVEVY